MNEVRFVPRDAGKVLEVLGVQVRFLCTGDDTGGASSVMEAVLPTDAGPPPHHHSWAAAYYVTEGAVDFTIAGEPRRVEAGEFVYAPGGTVHGFRGASAQPARLLVFNSPAHAQQFFEEASGEDDPAKASELGERHGIHFVLPPAALDGAF